MIFKKKEVKKTPEEIVEASEEEEAKEKEQKEEEEAKAKEEKGTPSASAADAAAMIKLTASVERLKAQLETFHELQKASVERFSIINEQIGGLRTMILDGDKDSKMLEAKATQAIDMVESVQPDKLMMELKKVDNRIEMIKSPIESNTAIIENTIKELKDIRTKFGAFKGIDESLKLGEEVKKAWVENKKIDANITKHSSKVETIYSEMWKKFKDFERFSSIISDVDKGLKQITVEVDTMKIKMSSFSTKKDNETLIGKLEAFEKHVDLVVAALNDKLDNFSKEFNQLFLQRMEKADKLVRGFEVLATKTPDLDKYFNLLENEAKKSVAKDIKIEKIKTPGEDEKIVKEKKEDEGEKEGFFSKVKNKVKKKDQLEG